MPELEPTTPLPDPTTSQESESSLLEQESQVLQLKPLTPRQASFVQEYVKDFNGKQAAIRAGYVPNNAEVTASYLLRCSHVAAAVAKVKAERAARVGISAETVLNELNVLAMASLEHYYVDDTGQVQPTETAPEGAMRALQSIKRKTTIKRDPRTGEEVSRTYDVEVRLWNKPEPLKLLGKHVGLNFNDKVEVTGRDGGPVEVAVAALTALSPEELHARAQALTKKLEEHLP